MNTINNNVNITQTPQPQPQADKGVGSKGEGLGNNKAQGSSSVDYTPASESKMRLAELRESINLGDYKMDFEKMALNIVKSGDV